MFSSYCNLSVFFTRFAEKKGISGGFSDCIRSILKTSKEPKPFFSLLWTNVCCYKELNYLTSKNFSSYHLLTPLFSLAAIAILSWCLFSSEAVRLLSFPLAALVAMAMLYKCCVFTALLLRGFNLIGIKTYFDSVHEEKGCFRRFYGFIYKFS